MNALAEVWFASNIVEEAAGVDRVVSIATDAATATNSKLRIMNAGIAEALASCNQLLEPSALANKPMSLERDVPLRGEQLGPGRIRE
jgi:hypothetical protein